MHCPECGSRCTGRVGAQQFYCWDCCVEFHCGTSGVQVFYLDAEGELTQAAAQGEAGTAAGAATGSAANREARGTRRPGRSGTMRRRSPVA